MAHDPQRSHPVTVFYDGGCGLCRREIDHYRRLDTAGDIQWVDITREEVLLQRVGLDRDAAMRRMYVRDAEGRLQSGAQAFVTLWQALPYYRHLASAVCGLRMLPLLEWCYVRFARWRYARRCPDGVCSTAHHTNSY